MNKNGGPAFPLPVQEPPYYVTNEVTLRDYLAAQNMPELLKLSWEIEKRTTVKQRLFEVFYKNKNGWINVAAKLSYTAADALLAEREKKENDGR